VFVQQPAPLHMTQCEIAQLRVQLQVPGPAPAFQWVQGVTPVSGPWFQNANTPILTVYRPPLSVSGSELRLRVTTPCGGVFFSQAAAVTVDSLADFDRDGDIGTDQDIEAFFACIAGECCPGCPNPDINRDGIPGNGPDIQSFFRVLAGGGC
jgi:hypothetical protein